MVGIFESNETKVEVVIQGLNVGELKEALEGVHPKYKTRVPGENNKHETIFDGVFMKRVAVVRPCTRSTVLLLV